MWREKRVKLREVAIVVLNKVEGEVFYLSVPTPISPSLRWQSLQWRGQMRRELFLLRRSFTTMTIVAAQRAFRTQLQIPSHVSVLDRKSILLWVKSFRETGSVVKKRGGRQRSSDISELIDAVRNSIL